jgi:hypothetical protein
MSEDDARYWESAFDNTVMAIEVVGGVAVVVRLGTRIVLTKTDDLAVVLGDDAAGAANNAADVPTITQNRARHEEAVQSSNEQFEANGLSTQTEVTLESCTGTRCRADTVIQGDVGQTSTPVPEGFVAYDLDGNQL